MLIVVDALVNDDKGKIIANFANFLIKNKVNVVIVCNFIKIRLLLNEKVKIININKIPLTKCIHFSFVIKTIIYFVCKINNINVINICDEKYIKYIVFFKKKIKTTVICWIFSIFNISTRYKYDCYKKIKYSDLIFSMSPDICDFLLNNFNSKKIIVIKNSIEKDYIYSADSDNKLIDNIGINGRVKELIKNIGIVDVFKKIFYCQCDYNHLDYCISLLRAIKRIEDRKKCIFIFSGTFLNTSKSRSKILETIKEFNLSECVKIIDCINDETAMISLSYAVICMYYNNGAFIRIASKTGLIKKPSIIIIHNTFIPNVIDGKTGFFTTYNNVEEIQTTIEKIINLPEEKYKEMCNNAYEYTTKFFLKDTFKDMNEKILTFIKK